MVWVSVLCLCRYEYRSWVTMVFATLRIMRYASKQRRNEIWRLIMSYGNWVLSFDQRFRTRVRSRFVWSVCVIMGHPGGRSHHINLAAPLVLPLYPPLMTGRNPRFWARRRPKFDHVLEAADRVAPQDLKTCLSITIYADTWTKPKENSIKINR
jgi:hypothetical protein